MLVSSSLSFADINAEDLEAIELIYSDDDLKTTKIKDIKNYLYETETSETCLDEMLQRRTQLLLKLVLLPITEQPTMIAQALGVNIFGILLGDSSNIGGELVVAGISVVSIGVLYSVVSAGVVTTKTVVNIKRLNLLIKALGEQYLEGGGVKSKKIYSIYFKHAGSDPMSEREFFDKMIELDRSGKLCDGSIVKKMPRLFKKTRSNFLKFRVANSNDFLSYLF